MTNGRLCRVILEDEEEFSSKNPGFYAFLLQKKHTRGQKPGPGGLIDPPGGLRYKTLVRLKRKPLNISLYSNQRYLC